MKNIFSFVFIGVLSLLTTACSSTGQSYIQSIKYAFTSNSHTFTLEEIAGANSDLMQVNVGERGNAVLALAYIDGDTYRWVSGDSVVVSMHKGVIVQTEGLAHDLYYTGNLKNNPLSENGPVPYRWDRKVDIGSVGYDLLVQSSWRVEGESTQTYLDNVITTLKIVETVVFPDTTPFIGETREWENSYYFDAQSKVLLASSQKLSPVGERFDMIYLSRIARVIESRERAQ